jgi:hypothetical protein
MPWFGGPGCCIPLPLFSCENWPCCWDGSYWNAITIDEMSKGHAAKWKELQEVYGVEYVEGGVLRKEGCRSKFFESEDEEGVGPQNV